MTKSSRNVLLGLSVLLLAAVIAIVVPSGGTSTAEADDLVEPVVVNLADVGPAPSDGEPGRGTLIRRTMRGGSEIAALRRASRGKPVDTAAQTKGNSPFLLAPVASTSFDSLDINDNPFDVVPPDPEMAAGPNHLIAIGNISFEIYDKTGLTLSGPTALDAFLGVNPDCTGHFDPNVLYDEKEDRFMIAADSDGLFYCAAVSQTGDPLGAYNVYAFPTGSVVPFEFFDYPHAGIGEDAIFMGANIFGPIFLIESRAYAMEKAAMYAGAPAGFIVNGLGVTQDTPQPMNLHGFAQGTWPTNLTHFFLTETSFNGCDHTLFGWDAPFSGGNTFGTAAAIDLCAATGVAASFPVDAVQAGAGGTITANDYRPLDFEYRNGFAWTTATVGCNPGGGTVDCVRWAQIDVTTTLGAVGPEGAGVFSSDGDYRIFPDLAVNDCNDMAVGYTKTNSGMFPSVWYSGRESGVDAPGTLQAEAELKAGEITYTAFAGAPHRWGDYTGMTIGPDGQTFWYLGEYSKITGNPNGRWGNFIGSFTFPDCDGGGLPLETEFIARMSGANNVPPTATGAFAGALIQTNGDQIMLPDCPTIDSCVRFQLFGKDIVDATMSHVHCAPPGVNGPIGLTLYDGVPVSVVGVGLIAEGALTAPDAGNTCGWLTLVDVMSAVRAGDTYVNVHTLAFPGGEVRGQLEPR